MPVSGLEEEAREAAEEDDKEGNGPGHGEARD